MIKEIRTIIDVQDFAKQIIAEGVSFHPDNDFHDYVLVKERKPCYSKDDAGIRNELMRQCFNVCDGVGADIYDVMLEVTLKETGMGKHIPLPSEAR